MDKRTRSGVQLSNFSHSQSHIIQFMALMWTSTDLVSGDGYSTWDKKVEVERVLAMKTTQTIMKTFLNPLDRI